ncbi:hypothetical protein BGX23_008140 [Mortierella sp. AD031]|nr:hypothetical protein BGX23_008140 [Mortierella sp. AD031]KAG0218919.1 hypothetical protein BGX33_005409 [Mortierella sp. NVP41]
MDFITYDFESPAQFYAELQDQLDGGGFHDSPESQVNAFISLLVQHQDDFLDASGQDLTNCCYRLFDSDLFQNNTLATVSAIVDRAIESQEDKDMWITYQILLQAGKENQKVFHWVMKSEYLAKLKYQILEMDGSRLQPLAIDLLFEICRVQSLKPRDLALVDEDLLHYLLDLVERTRTDADEGLNYGVIKLLLTFNEQYMLHMAACRAARQYTPSNPVLSALSDRPGASCTFGENLIFMLNRAEESALQMLILKLLYLLFTSPHQTLNDFFYTNDLHVLVDVVIRELWNLPEEEEPLRHAYLRVMGPLLANTGLKREQPTMYKRAEIIRVLSELGGDYLGDDLRTQLWEQEQMELMQQQEIQSRLWSEKTLRLTYRDFQSSNSPALKFATVQGATACGSPVQQPQPLRAGGPLNATGSSSGSLVLENVLPYSNNNSSTNLHIHVSPPPSSGGHPQPTRRDSRPTSPTTQRLVERVLREWLEQELKNAAAAASSVAQGQVQGLDGGRRNGGGDVSAVGSDQRIAITVAQ